MIDTGIDYLNSEFINADDTTRIEAIWDQTIYNDNNESIIPLGTFYNSGQINKAIAAKKNGNDKYIYSQKIKSYLTRGTQKRPNDTYPNPEWGYGVLDMLGVFKYIQ